MFRSPKKNLTWSCYLSAGLSLVLSSALTPALNEIAQEFGESSLIQDQASARWLISTKFLAMVIAAPFGALLMRTYKQTLLTLRLACIFLILGPFSLFFFSSLKWFFLLQFFCGLAVGLASVAAPSLLSFVYATKERLKVFGYRSAFNGFFNLLYSIVGGVIALWNWRYTYFLLTFNSLAVLLLTRSAKNIEIQKAELDENHCLWKKWEVKNLMIIGFLILVWGSSFYLIQMQFPFFLRETHQFDSSKIGLFLAFYTTLAILTSLLLKKIIGFFQQKSFAYIHSGLCFFVVLGFLLTSWFDSVSLILLSLGCLGAARGVIMPLVQQALSLAVQSSHRSFAFALLTLLSRAAGGFATIFLNLLSKLKFDSQEIFAIKSLLFAVFLVVFFLFFQKKNFRID